MNTQQQNLSRVLYDICNTSGLTPDAICGALQACFTIMRGDNTQTLIDYDFGGLRIEIERKIALLNNEPIAFTGKEWQIMTALIRANGKKISQSEMHSILYGNDVKSSNTLEVFMSHLRKKIGKGFISTYRGQGYVLSSMNF